MALSLQRLRTVDRAAFQRWLAGDTAWLIYPALVALVMHLLVANNYGYFRDELYYMADGRHLAPGYVDQPPMIGVLALLTHIVFGDSLFAIHILPAVALAVIVFMTGLMARDLGGGRYTQWLAEIAVVTATGFMAIGSMFGYDVFDWLWWTLGAYVLLRYLRTSEPRLWLIFGVIAGLGLLTKPTMLFFGLAVTVGVLCTPQRAIFRTRWPYLGGAIAFILWSPYILWNVANGGQSLQFYANYGGHGGGPIDLIVNQIVLLDPATLFIAALGVYYCLGTAAGKPYRAFGWAYVTLIALFVILNVKPYFLTASYPPFIAFGAVWVAQRWQGQRARTIMLSVCLLFGILLAPLAMPMLPPATFAHTYGAISGLGNGAAGQSNAGVFPQYLGDRFGWNTMTATVARAYHALPAAQQAQACILTINYGEASAMELLGKSYHLPRVISGHNNYYLWGPGNCSGQVILAVGYSAGDLQRGWGSVQQVSFITCDYCQAEENDLPVYLATQPKFSGSLKTMWAQFKHYD